MQSHYGCQEGEGGLCVTVLPRTTSCRRAVEDLVGKITRQTLLIGAPLELKFLKYCLSRGLGGYLLYSVTAENLIAAAAAVSKGECYIDPDLRTYWVDMQLGNERHSLGTFAIELTRREREVLQLIVEEFTTSEIADRLFIATSTVESHRANILAKLGVRNVAGLVREAIRRQLCVVG